MMGNRLPPDSNRGRIRDFIERHADKLGDDVMEAGCRAPAPGCWWIEYRDLAQGRWTGVDMQPGYGVDVVADIHDLPAEWAGRFSAVLIAEVMEHVARPWVALPKLREVIRPGGWIVITTLFAFPEHGFPDDYYRFTRSGLQLLLEDAGFVDVHTEYAGGSRIPWNDHGDWVRSDIAPMHVFAVARC